MLLYQKIQMGIAFSPSNGASSFSLTSWNLVPGLSGLSLNLSIPLSALKKKVSIHGSMNALNEWKIFFSQESVGLEEFSVPNIFPPHKANMADKTWKRYQWSFVIEYPRESTSTKPTCPLKKNENRTKPCNDPCSSWLS